MTARARLLPLVVLAVSLGAACSHAPKPVAGAPAAQPFSRMHSVSTDSVSITIERTPCFGFCPSYKTTISGRGEVVYHGSNYVGVKGEQRGTMPVDAVVELVNEFFRLRFESTPPEYASRLGVERQGDRLIEMHWDVTDLPTTILTLQLGEWSKTTRFYVDYPVEYRALADSIDAKSGALRWIAGGKAGGKAEER